jgi:Polyketide cyclase / dehydrase and lipid transport
MAASTSARIMIDAPRADVMAVIADFAAYPQWASGVRAAETLGQDASGRASRVRFTLDAGLVKDTYVLGYAWDGDAGVRWQLAEAGSVISGMSGGYALAENAGATEATYDLAVDVRIPMPGLLKRRAEKTIIDTALNGLKNRAERLSGQPGSSGRAGREPGGMGGDGR